MRNQRDVIAYVRDINEALDRIIHYSSSTTYEEFAKSEWDQAAVMRQFEIIGEAVVNIDFDFKNTHSEIEWRDMIDFRNFLIHDYADIDVTIVWDAMIKNVPPLKKKIESIIHNV